MPFGNVQSHEKKPRKLPVDLGETWEKQKADLQTSLSTAPQSGGREASKRYLSGENLNRTEAMLAKCFDCCGQYVDGKKDCEVPLCTLYPWMPYRKKTA
jgi:hypothetical protein